MAKRNTKTAKPAAKKATSQTVTRVERNGSSSKEESMFERMSDSFQKNQSFFNIILGGLIVVVLSVLLFNYFNKPTEDLASPAQQTENMVDNNGDVTKEALPGKYTIKDGDTLFAVAQNYYGDGYKYPELVKANNLSNENAIVTGQALTIPRLDDNGQAVAVTSPSPSEIAMASSSPDTASASPVAMATPTATIGATGGAENATAWGDKITGDSYVVQEGDWLSKIAGRAYGDVMSFQKIAEANNITDPNRIEVGTTVKIPR